MSPVPDLPSTQEDQSEKREEERREKRRVKTKASSHEKDSEMMFSESA